MLNYPNQDLVVYLMALNYISLISIVKHIKENSNQKIIYTFYIWNIEEYFTIFGGSGEHKK